ncbi:MAG: hypothetical protein HY586_02720 [Candidatus Omnitrophica bacterium]|nr:hypothetical protein [Candidatus Omnitrophota bacterium]
MKLLRLSILFFFIQSFFCMPFAGAQTPDQWPEEYVGTWKLTNQAGDHRYINLYDSRNCTTTFDRKTSGTWLYHPDQNEVRMQWSNEWADVLVKENGLYKNYGYAPGTDSDNKPTEEWTAEKVAANPFDYLGVWKGTDVKGNSYQFTLNIDDTAILDSQGGQKGSWEILGDQVRITWPASAFLLLQQGNRYKAKIYQAASTDGTPTAVADIERTQAALRSDPNAMEY